MAFGDTATGYDPYQMSCVFQAKTKVKAVADIDLPSGYLGLSLERLEGYEAGRIDWTEFCEVFIFFPGENAKVDTEAKKVAALLNVDFAEVYTITQFILFDGISTELEMIFYKLNTKDGSLGIVVATNRKPALTICQ